MKPIPTRLSPLDITRRLQRGAPATQGMFRRQLTGPCGWWMAHGRDVRRSLYGSLGGIVNAT